MLGNQNLCRCMTCGRLDLCTNCKKVDGRYICSICQANPPKPEPVNTWQQAKPEGSKDV
jgi:recombinational DNA repair protein (RecF pathway)